MNLEGFRKELIQAARRTPVSDAVPYAFEQRVLQAIRSTPLPDPILPWVAGFARAAFCALAVALVSGALHWRSLSQPAPGLAELPDAELLEFAVLGDLPDFEAADPESAAQ